MSCYGLDADQHCLTTFDGLNNACCSKEDHTRHTVCGTLACFREFGLLAALSIHKPVVSPLVL